MDTYHDSEIVQLSVNGDAHAFENLVKRNEYAFLKLRYKLPGTESSRLIIMPIGMEREYQAIDRVPGEARFANGFIGKRFNDDFPVSYSLLASALMISSLSTIRSSGLMLINWTPIPICC